jgi:chloride channel protein, CIC family
MFLIRRASEVMDRDVLKLPCEADLAALLTEEGGAGGFKHVIVTAGDRIVGVLRVNTALRQGLADTQTGITLGDVALRRFVIARENDIVFDVVTRMSRRRASMAVIVSGTGRPRVPHVVGIISKEHIADSVADSIRPYAR